jgi:hypothetical protein
MKPWQAIERRTFLRGVGTAIALPWLDAMQGSVARAAAGVAAGPPIRMAFLYVPNGMNMPDWAPRSEGPLGVLPPTLAPLAKFRSDITVLTGLSQYQGNALGDGAGDHARAASVFLTGAHPKKTKGKDIRVGVSVDQIAAKHFEGQTRFASLELGCEDGRLAGDCDSGYSCSYSNSISWRSPTTPNGKEVNPRMVFNRLFALSESTENATSQVQRDHYQRSILDFVRDDAKRLHGKLGQGDRRRVDEYLTGIRDIERRMERPSKEIVTGSELQRPAGMPDDFDDRVRLMGDLLTIAFQTDATRVATLMFANEGSDRKYADIGVREGHHTLSHHQNAVDKVTDIAKINYHHVTLLAYLLGRLKAVPEGEGNLLDSTMLVYGSGIGDGNAHDHDNLPILIAGRGQGLISPGRHVLYPEGTPLMNLFLSMLRHAGVPCESAGDSTGVLPKLTV